MILFFPEKRPSVKKKKKTKKYFEVAGWPMTKLFDKKKKKEKAQSDPVSQMQGINVATRKEEFF